MEVAASVDVVRGRVLYVDAAHCGAAPGALLNILRAHPSLCACKDVQHQLHPFFLLATMSKEEAGDVTELLLLNPDLVGAWKKCGAGSKTFHWQ